jgi:phosphate transport system permease protein
MRMGLNKAFTILALLSLVLITGALLVILGPMLFKGAGAMVKSTVEFRELQYHEFGNGDLDEINEELARAEKAREPVWRTLNGYRQWLDPDTASSQARRIYRDAKEQIEKRYEAMELPPRQRKERFWEIEGVLLKARKALERAYEASELEEAEAQLEKALAPVDNPELKGTKAEKLFALARDYREVIHTVPFADREQYVESFEDLSKAVRDLLGPAPWDPEQQLAQSRYGASRQYLIDRALFNINYDIQHVASEDPNVKTLVETHVPRAEQLAGTGLVDLVGYINDNIEPMLMPEWTFHWRYWIQSAPPGHYIGGIGPEIYGTVLLTVGAILVSLPIGVIAAAYLVECAGENVVVRAIRMCINTLAGVPSIVFGLFGLAFFVLYIQPRLGQDASRSIFAGAMTLGVMVLPIIIRASEEAIRSVPQTYREAALGLGASRFRCFVTVTLPAALPGVLTGTILSMSRAAGETAPILYTAGVATVSAGASASTLPTSVWDSTRALSYGTWDVATTDKVAMEVPHQQFGMVATLVVLVLVLNVVAIALRSRVARKLRGQ